jgi:hypothetical protein
MSPIGLVPKHSEMKPLARALEDLLEKLRQKIEAEQTFVASAAHEMRTPLAVVTAQAHVLARATTDEERSDAEHRLEAGISRASHLIHQLLVLAGVDMDHHPSARTTVDLAPLARQEIAYFVPAATAREIDISLETPARLAVMLEPQSFRSVLQNLVDNAIRYGREGGRHPSGGFRQNRCNQVARYTLGTARDPQRYRSPLRRAEQHRPLQTSTRFLWGQCQDGERNDGTRNQYLSIAPIRVLAKCHARRSYRHDSKGASQLAPFQLPESRHCPPLATGRDESVEAVPSASGSSRPEGVNRALELTTANPPFAQKLRRPSNASRRNLFQTGFVADNFGTLQLF